MSSVSHQDSGRKKGAGSQDFELNLASIIDCFTVLITFLLASASFMSIGIFDAGVAAAGSESQSDKPPGHVVSVELNETHQILLKVEGPNGQNVFNLNVPAQSTPNSEKDSKNPTNFDTSTLSENLKTLKEKYSDAQAVTLSADNSIPYKDVIFVMEQIRKIQPIVLLGGF